MMRRYATLSRFSSALLLAALPLSAHAWGPRAESAIVTSAAQLLSKNGLLQIQRIEEDLRKGSLTPQPDLERIFPGLATDPVNAVETEMMLLQAVRQPQMDAYYAFRLGALGKLVANITAPLTQTDPAIANLYYADVEKNIQTTALIPQAAKDVDPAPYFERRVLEANTNTDVIAGEYRSGVGFDGVAKNLLQQDASRSVAAVSDVWRTILSASAAVNVSPAQQEAYVVDAYRYYIAGGVTGQIESADRRLSELAPQTPDLLIRVGDLFYDAGMREEAIGRYEQALAQAPQRRDVAERIGEYYMSMGQTAKSDNRLEDALKAFEQALDSNPLGTNAEAERLDVAAMIADRDARLAASQAALESAGGFENLAEQEALDARIAEAVALYHQARAEYDRVDESFPLEYQKAMTGIRDIDAKLEGLREQLFANAQLLSGVGFGLDASRFATAEGKKLDNAAFRAMINDALAATLADLEAQSQDLLRIE
jgi:tetratricopeptide (TPR) repeat protein